MTHTRQNGRINQLPFACAIVPILFVNCPGPTDKDFLGSAVVEVETYEVVSTVQGQLVAVYKNEGEEVASGETLSVVDTVPLRLNLDEVTALFGELQQQIAARRAEVEASKAEIRGLKKELDRVRALVEKGSLPEQKRDNLETKYETAQFKLKVAKHMLAGLGARRQSLKAKEAQLLDRLRRCFVVSPCDGIVLTKYKNTGEIAGPAFPLLQIGRYDSVRVDFFVPQPLLAELKVGQQLRVRIDSHGGSGDQDAQRFVPARISWVSNDAEFSPRNVQTREARNELVFRVRATAANDQGLLKRGLPVEVWR